MKLASMFFANDADMNGDQLQVTGGLWDGLTATHFPANHEIVVVALLRPEPTDVGVAFHVDLDVKGPTGASVGHSHGDITLNKFRQQTAVVLKVRASFPIAGQYKVVFSSTRIATEEVSFLVVGPDETPVAAAVEGYALGLNK